MSKYTAEQVEACVRGMELDGIVRLMLLDHAATLRKGKSEYEKDMEDTLSQIAEAVGFIFDSGKTADDLITHIKQCAASNGDVTDAMLPKEMVEGDPRNPYSDQLISYGYTAGFNKCRELMLSSTNKSID